MQLGSLSHWWEARRLSLVFLSLEPVPRPWRRELEMTVSKVRRLEIPKNRLCSLVNFVLSLDVLVSVGTFNSQVACPQ